MNKITLLGIAGNGFSGKDTLYLILEKILKESNIETDRIALADPLKSELSEFTKSQYGINIFTKDYKEKEIIRPIMVSHGKIRRTLSQGRYFTDIAQKRLKENIEDGILSIVTDIRYMFYQTDEVDWLKSNNGLLVYIERINQDGSIVPPANEDERENNEKIKLIADYTLRWPTTDNLDIRSDCVSIQLHNLIERIKNEN